ncbi:MULTISPECIES: peptidoglycan-binding domain-containing protein [Streptomyces]|uniref:peptidoglycan-binding domain-containing protein n=1 Tax=Streptomyces TaxID=1883 RepID=UPI003448DD87
MSLRLRVGALVISTVATLGIAVTAAPASASVGSGYVSGVETWTDDWYDEGPLTTSSNSHSNVVAMWQAILWADGKLAYSGIDCRFGSGTYNATRAWQAAYGVGVDGKVGSETFKKAATYLRASNGKYIYDGTNGRYVTFTRSSEGIWGMYVGNDHHQLGYGYANFDVCG